MLLKLLHGSRWNRKTRLHSLNVLGTCSSKNGSKMALQSLGLHFGSQFMFDAGGKGCWK